MAAPKFVPLSPVEIVRGYASPDHVPDGWHSERPGDLEGRQPEGERLGYQGPDQGYALTLAERMRHRLNVGVGLHADDAIRGCTAIALRRASLFGRAPVIHDLTIAFTIWGFLNASPPADLVSRRLELFEGAGNVAHHYAEVRRIADLVPAATLRMTPRGVADAWPARWRELTGA